MVQWKVLRFKLFDLLKRCNQGIGMHHMCCFFESVRFFVLFEYKLMHLNKMLFHHVWLWTCVTCVLTVFWQRVQKWAFRYELMHAWIWTISSHRQLLFWASYTWYLVENNDSGFMHVIHCLLIICFVLFEQITLADLSESWVTVSVPVFVNLYVIIYHKLLSHSISHISIIYISYISVIESVTIASKIVCTCSWVAMVVF